MTLQNTQLECTCPEDCSRNAWRYKDNSDVKSLVFNCSTSPTYKETVEECLENFDVNNHPNRRLLPKTHCGRQKTGARNSV